MKIDWNVVLNSLHGPLFDKCCNNCDTVGSFFLFIGFFLILIFSSGLKRKFGIISIAIGTPLIIVSFCIKHLPMLFN